MSCLKESKDVHHKCKELSRDYLQCRMDHQLMSKEDLEGVSLPPPPTWRWRHSFRFGPLTDVSFFLFLPLLLQLGFSKEQEVKGAVEYDKR